MAALATLGFVVGILVWPVAIGVADTAIVTAATALVLGLFAWFRSEHLRELERRR
jgi:hypothetical protein